MSTPATRARYLRGALVGACSALLTGAAHCAAGGDLPGSGPLTLLLVGCATVGALTATLTTTHRYARLAMLITALGAGQFVGHFALTITAGGHGHGMTVLMVTAHAAAAVALGLLIGLSEYLYLVARSVLCWLWLVLCRPGRPITRAPLRAPKRVAAPSVLLCSGRGMRAPPRRGYAGV
ncbi:hypothetical protein [Mycolicibacterium thermoresistibile]